MLLPQAPEGAAATLVLPRPRLLDLIEEPTQAPITLVSAPAGFGKTTLATQWAQQTSDHVVWLSLDPKHNDPGLFLEQLASRLASVRELSAHKPTVQSILDGLSGTMQGHPVTIVLDDLHRISSEEVLRTISRLLAAGIPDIRWLLLSRIVSRLSLARMRAEGQVREIGTEDLAFTNAEIAEVVLLLRSRAPSGDQIDRLAAFSSGWIAGIRLTLLAIGPDMANTEREGHIGAVAAEWVDTYVAEEILDQWPVEVRDFALRTCELPYLTPGFASHVAGTSDEEGRRILSLLERQFIVGRQMTESGSTTQYVVWIAGSLRRLARQQLSLDERGRVYERTGEYLLAQDQHALALAEARKADDLSLRMRTVRRLHAPLALQDRTVLIRDLLETLPASALRQHPDLSYSYAYSLFHRGDSTALASHVSKILPAWRPSADAIIRGYAMNCKAFTLYRAGDSVGALHHYKEALEHFPQTSYRERLHALAGVFESASDMGDDATAERAMQEAAGCTSFLPRHQVTWWMNIRTRLANHHALRGHIALAGELYDYVLENAPPTFTRHYAYFWYRMAALRFESNDLAGAEELIAASVAVIERRDRDDWHADALALGARIARARGERDLADVRLQEAREKASHFGNQHDLMRVETIQASWNIADGDVVAARVWETFWQPEAQPWIQSFGQRNVIATLMQLRISEHRFADAILIGDQALVEGARRHRYVEMISIMMWGALARQYDGAPADARAMLRRALETRREDTLVRAFATPGHDIDPALVIGLPRRLRPAFNDLAVRLNMSTESRTPWESSTPRLTSREREVLVLLADSLSNQEISERLFITERTVKKHVGNIMRKLNVPNRTAAVMFAQERGWIDG